ncbi:MAG TPA: xanthine dehydrogenase family protein molybdopterin-binding subunit [Steroidobacteraceae bacterium]|nr:xanthine dehydrogenase family protein molybdopterin-binding subunit [Steroidobacteraceae bacterium]
MYHLNDHASGQRDDGMDRTSPPATSRRELLKAGSALTVAFLLPWSSDAAEKIRNRAVDPHQFAPNAFIRITEDNIVTVISKHLEMGQGTYTGLATIVAEELDADWSQVRVEGAPANAKLYANLQWGGSQGTGGSSSIANSFTQLQQAGATARALLVNAAAKKWNVSASDISIRDGVLSHAASGKTARFGELVSLASQLPQPTQVQPKKAADYRLIGKPIQRIDARDKSTGHAVYTQDMQLPGMLVAVAAHPPRFGAVFKHVDDTRAKAMKGVHAVVPFNTTMRSGVAVIANDFWTAKQARDALQIEWDETHAFNRSSDDLFSEYRALSLKPGQSVRNDGNVEQALKSAATALEAIYEFPYLAHASMEPLNCVVRVGEDECEVWNGEQFQTNDQGAISDFLDIPASKVKIHQLYAGGSFGRRANAFSDYVIETVAIARAANLKSPLKLVWTREQDMQAGFYRPMFVHRVHAALDAQHNITAWQHRVVGQSTLQGTNWLKKGEVDSESVVGIKTLPYHIPNLSVDAHTPEFQVPVQWWRSVGSTHTAFAVECFMNDIARETRQDPFELRRKLLAGHARHLAVLNLLEEKSDWKSPRAENEALGVALHESFNTVVGEVVRIKRINDKIKIEHVTCVVDCGLAINPNVVAMQMESGIGYGLAAILNGEITFRNGYVQQDNFDSYPVLRMNQMPDIDVHIVPSSNKPTGVGEPGTPVIGPALVNAITMLTGKVIRKLPLKGQVEFV